MDTQSSPVARVLSQRTPMLLGRDEFGRTQQGNNNAYCQDNEVSWVDWNHDENGRALTRFVARMTTLRSRYPVLRQSRFLTGERNESIGVKVSTWLTPVGAEMTAEHWQDPRAHCVGLLLDGRAQTSGISRTGSEATLLLVVNADHDLVLFTWPQMTGGRDWLRLFDTNSAEEDDPDEPVCLSFGHRYHASGRSLLLFAVRPERRRVPR